jgi:hypothetical protein
MSCRRIECAGVQERHFVMCNDASRVVTTRDVDCAHEGAMRWSAEVVGFLHSLRTQRESVTRDGVHAWALRRLRAIPAFAPMLLA